MTLKNLFTSFFKRSNYKTLIPFITPLVLFISFLTMLEWIIDKRIFFTAHHSFGTTKFNTAFLFFISALSILIFKRNQKKNKTIFIINIVIILTFSFLTLLEYIFKIDLFIDNLFIKDTLSDLNPGRMSIATTLCFTFFGIGLTSLIATNNIYRKISQYKVLLVSMISFISIITYLLKIETSVKTLFFESMSIQTSVTFALIAFSLALKFPGVGFTKMLFGNYFGSKSLRRLIPFIVIIPCVLSYLLIISISKENIEPQFGILIYTIVLIFLSFIYTSLIALGLNKSDRSRKNLEDNLIHKNEELQQFKDSLDEIAIVAITDENATIKYVNENFCEISKFTREEIIGNTSLIVRSDYHPESYFWDAWHQVASGTPWIGEIKNKAKDGTHYWTETAVIPLKTRIGSIREFMSIQLDITKRKEAEELLASKYVKTLEQKNKELEQFSYIASHDLQEPLRTISSSSEYIYEEYYDKLDDNAKQIFEFIKSATGRMSDLIKNLLDYSRIGYKEQPKETDCNQIFQELSDDLSILISQSNAHIEINTLPTINAYPIVLRLLFQNLITNAIKFSKKGVNPIVQVDCIKKRNAYEFSIKDNGIGIKKEYQTKIFAIFQQLHLKGEYKGTGIGLAHCQKIVNLHGGEIWVKSKLGEGSTFYFTIPIKIS